MALGDTAVLAAYTSYQCSEGGANCAVSSIMLWQHNLYGTIKCADDAASCNLDGQGARRLICVRGTGGQTLTFRALRFSDGQGNSVCGGGAYIFNGALVDIELCVFTNCRSICSSNGGGAIYVASSGCIVAIYGTRFYGNEALNEGKVDDIYHHPDSPGTIIIHATCPSPYTATNPTQGQTRTTTKGLHRRLHYLTTNFTFL